MRHFPEHAAACQDGEAKVDALAQRVCSACVGAAKQLQRRLFVPASITGSMSAEALMADAQVLVLMWRLCVDLAGKVGCVW